MVKGGITFGEFYIDHIMVWGKGLVETYCLESDRGHIFPTICLGGGAKSIVQDNRSRFQMVSNTEVGELFVDYLKFKDKSSEEASVLKLHQNVIVEMFDSIKNDRQCGKKISESILTKLNWLHEYHNRTCREQKRDDCAILSEILLCYTLERKHFPRLHGLFTVMLRQA